MQGSARRTDRLRSRGYSATLAPKPVYISLGLIHTALASNSHSDASLPSSSSSQVLLAPHLHRTQRPLTRSKPPESQWRLPTITIGTTTPAGARVRCVSASLFITAVKLTATAIKLQFRAPPSPTFQPSSACMCIRYSLARYGSTMSVHRERVRLLSRSRIQSRSVCIS